MRMNRLKSLKLRFNIINYKKALENAKNLYRLGGIYGRIKRKVN